MAAASNDVYLLSFWVDNYKHPTDRPNCAILEDAPIRYNNSIFFLLLQERTVWVKTWLLVQPHQLSCIVLQEHIHEFKFRLKLNKLLIQSLLRSLIYMCSLWTLPAQCASFQGLVQECFQAGIWTAFSGTADLSGPLAAPHYSCH